MKIKFLALTVGVAITSFGAHASDNIGKKVWDSFRSEGVSVHTTRPSQFDSRFGSHWSGGYVRVRTKQTKAKNVMDFTPPRLSGGCSGIDFYRSEEHTSELQSRPHLVCRLLLEKKKNSK